MESAFYRSAPRISKAEFDSEANVFLQQYYPEALKKPMAIPIEYVARHRMGLRIVEKRLTEDFSILGQMCFTSGLTEIYDKENDEYRKAKVRYGTMIIDPDTINKRNDGCRNNTIAHECFHWHKHRDYYIAASVHIGKRAIERHFSYEEKSESSQALWTDEDWMEWQARGIAPRILMPVDQFNEVVNRLNREYASTPTVNQQRYSLRIWMINSLADFFKVSKQSAEIRLEETGYIFQQ